MKPGRTILMMFPGDTTATVIPVEAIAAARQAGAKPHRPVPNFSLGPGGIPVQAEPKMVADMAPVLGGVTGSMAGEAVGRRGGAPGQAVGRVAGGVAGGTGGKVYQEGMYRAMGLGDAPGTVGDEAAFQAKAGLAGEVLGGISNATGRGVIRTGLPARLQDEWRAVSEMVRERLPVGGLKAGPINMTGGARAGRNLATKTAARDAANSAAGAAGVEIDAGPMEKKMLQMVDHYQLRGDRSAQLSALSKRMDDFMVTWKNGKLSPKDAQEYLTSLDEEAKTLWKSTEKMGQHVPEAERKAAQQAKQIAGVLRQQFRASVPGHLKTSRNLSSAISAKNAIDEAEHMGVLSLGSRLATGALLGTGVEQFADPHHDPAGYMTKAGVGMLLAHPALSSRLGLSMAGGATNQIARQAPRMVSPELLRLLNLSGQ